MARDEAYWRERNDWFVWCGSILSSDFADPKGPRRTCRTRTLLTCVPIEVVMKVSVTFNPPQ